ncbi:MAG: YggT family protein [Rhizobiaceae bacterium]|nr:MAG: YggT family protein [Rhizobiaceae bacterium]
MVALIQFIFFVTNAILSLIIFVIIVSAILSWLFAFDVLNRRNRGVAQIADMLERIAYPILEPFRRIIPPLGGIDVSPIIVIILLQGVKAILLPWAEAAALAPFI